MGTACRGSGGAGGVVGGALGGEVELELGLELWSVLEVLTTEERTLEDLVAETQGLTPGVRRSAGGGDDRDAGGGAEEVDTGGGYRRGPRLGLS